jgi:hypothetical protein
LLLVGAGLALVQKAGAAIPTAVIGAFPLGVGALIAVAYFVWRRNRSLASSPRPATPDAEPVALTR